MLAIYLHAVLYLSIKTIEHKFLICGRTQNEGDGTHSLKGYETSEKRCQYLYTWADHRDNSHYHESWKTIWSGWNELYRFLRSQIIILEHAY